MCEACHLEECLGKFSSMLMDVGALSRSSLLSAEASSDEMLQVLLWGPGPGSRWALLPRSYEVRPGAAFDKKEGCGD